MVERRAVSSADVLNDPAIDLSPSSRRFVESEGYRGALAVPLLADTRVLGVLLAGRDRVGSFSPDQAEVARAFSEKLRTGCEKLGVGYVDLNPVVAERVTEKDWVFVDRAHYTDYGYDLVAGVLAETLGLS